MPAEAQVDATRCTIAHAPACELLRLARIDVIAARGPHTPPPTSHLCRHSSSAVCRPAKTCIPALFSPNRKLESRKYPPCCPHCCTLFEFRKNSTLLDSKAVASEVAMIIANRTVMSTSAATTRHATKPAGLCSARPTTAVSSSQRRNILLRYKEVNKPEPLESITLEELENELRSSKPPSPETWRPQGTKLNAQQVQEVIAKEPGNISPRMAEMRADLGNAATDLSQFQAFDGPAPETINGRLAMLGVVVGLLGEWFTGLGLLEQTGDHPITVFSSFLLISFASYAPIARGYTRKEPFANSIWTPKAENWNGRLAMLGFTAMILTEAITGVNTLQAWGLQSVLHHMNM